MLHTGVYIGSDFEMVVTERYIITYRRDKKWIYWNRDCIGGVIRLFYVLVSVSPVLWKQSNFYCRYAGR